MGPRAEAECPKRGRTLARAFTHAIVLLGLGCLDTPVYDGRTCSAEEPCPVELVCDADARCRTPCTTDGDCDDTRACAADGRCRVRCADDDACEGAERCREGLCLPE